MLAACVKDPAPATIKQSDLQGPSCSTAYSYVDYHLLTPKPSDCASCELKWEIPADASIYSTSTSGIRVRLGKNSGKVKVKMISDAGEGNTVTIDIHIDKESGSFSEQYPVYDDFNGLENPYCFLVGGVPHLMHNRNDKIEVYTYAISSDKWTLKNSFSDQWHSIQTEPQEIGGSFYFIDIMDNLKKYDPSAGTMTTVSQVPASGEYIVHFAYNNKFYCGLKHNTNSDPLPDQYLHEYTPGNNTWVQSYKLPEIYRKNTAPRGYNIVAGGKVISVLSRNTNSDDILVLNPNTQTATEAGSFKFSIQGAPRGLFLLNNKVLAIGAKENVWIDPVNESSSSHEFSSSRQCPKYINDMRLNGYFNLNNEFFFVGGLNSQNSATKDVLRLIP
ncbi:MAG: hypothetical protein ACKOXB_01835 [Flavobacteriales bacterium]